MRIKGRRGGGREGGVCESGDVLIVKMVRKENRVGQERSVIEERKRSAA